jgi:hypothetical protein
MSEHILYELICGTLVFGSLNDASITTSRCHIHNKREPIVRVQTSEWLSNCHDCNWRRWYGNDQGKARDESRRHWLRHPDHKGTVSKRERYTSKMAEMDLRKKVADMGWTWYNGRVQPGTMYRNSREELPEEPPF